MGFYAYRAASAATGLQVHDVSLKDRQTQLMKHVMHVRHL